MLWCLILIFPMPLYSYYKIITELTALSGYQKDIFFSCEDFTTHTFTTLLTNIKTFLFIWSCLLSHHTLSFSNYIPLSAHVTPKGVQCFFLNWKGTQFPWGLCLVNEVVWRTTNPLLWEVFQETCACDITQTCLSGPQRQQCGRQGSYSAVEKVLVLYTTF